ncbi:phospholipid carrier-dependent glycosyltransferase [Nonomuraea sp. NPDC050643]|uniref:phospholipid carrier-dependent glycosyltransferase n=1 Tax=Nonomuraea sp. NPDC050643 TaxID=3155660 RepID=UPI0033F45224
MDLLSADEEYTAYVRSRLLWLRRIAYSLCQDWHRADDLVAGTLSILVMARVARRMTRSTVLGCLAGLLLALDGLHFVLSRTALLDVFLMFWVLAAFACVVADRDWVRQRWTEASPPAPAWLRPGVRPWRAAAGICLGAACAVKWSGVFFLLAFALLSLLWDAGAWRALGRRPRPAAALQGFAGAFTLVPGAIYVLSWSGWFLRAEGWGRGWEQATQAGPGFFVLDSLRSWLGYQVQVLGFHTGLETPHAYMSEPWQWPLLQRPVAFHYQSPPDACAAKDCSQAVLGVGTPALWYLALLALLVLVARYVAVRDWRNGVVQEGHGGGRRRSGRAPRPARLLVAPSGPVRRDDHVRRVVGSDGDALVGVTAPWNSGLDHFCA